ncbi:uncharacterized protein APUU_20267A [Aspergillus puulaauensis]|uniref:Uncharacterized protein n=1 Tax=Aspergillus puulaauensis TaxID=1220207 RepID=A0A7R7XEG3_9EURO|nr:uncharacterized protein APUU_20267A [Aspergillus puulaauensis]BCS19835.1 hypothetical protein APUU_20267A [Aspergillus puulaauensis]
MSRNQQTQFSSFHRPAPRQGGRPSGTGAWRSAPQNSHNQRSPQTYSPGHGQRNNYQNNPQNNHKNNYHNNRNNAHKGVFHNNKPRHAGAGLDFDNDTTMTGMPSPYSAKQWRRIQYLRQLRDTHQYEKLDRELNGPDSKPQQDVDMVDAPPLQTPDPRYSDLDMLDVPDNF